MVTWFEEDLKGITHYVLKTINVKGNRRFVSLDHISTKKEQTLDPEDRQVVNRWTSNLFIQEKNQPLAIFFLGYAIIVAACVATA